MRFLNPWFKNNVLNKQVTFHFLATPILSTSYFPEDLLPESIPRSGRAVPWLAQVKEAGQQQDPW